MPLVTAPLPHPLLVGPLADTLEVGLIITPTVFGLTLAGFPAGYPGGGYPDLLFAVGWSLAIGWPRLLEMIAMTAAVAHHPEHLGTSRHRKALVKAGRYALTQDFLVRSPGRPQRAGQRLMTSLTTDWRRHKRRRHRLPRQQGPHRFSLELGARRDYLPEAGATGNAAWPSTPRRQRKRPHHDEPPHLNHPMS